MSNKHTVYLGLGSNMHDPPARLRAGIAALRALHDTQVERLSPLYGSKAWGKTDQPDFLNMVVEIATELEPTSLLKHVKQIEAEQGRTAGERWGPRPLDIDILLYDNIVVVKPDLVIPHKRMWERAFVLRPLTDLRPDLMAPDNIPVKDLLESDLMTAQGVWLVSDALDLDDRKNVE